MEIKNSIIAIPPGETIKDQLKIREMHQTEFAKRMGMSTKHISQLINGKVPLTHQTTLKLESVLGIPARFWNNLEAIYQEDLARIEQEIELEEELSIVALIPFNEMAKKGWVKATKIAHEKVDELRSYFGVASLKNLVNINKLEAVFRKLDNGKASDYALSAWLQKGYLEAHSIETEPFNKSKLRSMIPELRSLANEDPDIFQHRLTSLLSKCGVALVFLPHLKGTYAHGATMWPTKHKAIVLISLRGKDADRFWFSLFHEIGHLILHKKDDEFIHYDDIALQDELEIEADQFSSDLLISPDAYHKFISANDFSALAVQQFSRSISIPSGVIVGRLQHDKYIPYTNLNKLKTKYQWSNDILN